MAKSSSKAPAKDPTPVKAAATAKPAAPAKVEAAAKAVTPKAAPAVAKAPKAASKGGKAPRTHHVAVLAGDGIGEEVVREGLKVLDAVAAIEGFSVERKVYPYGADHYLATKEAMPASALAEMADMDAIFLGAIGDPRVETGFLERQIIWGVRQTFDLYVNLRPIRLYHEALCPLKDKKPADVDMVVVRENT